MNDALDAIERRIGYQFSNPELLQIALTHRSKSKKNNERLEFLGDSIVNCVVAWMLFQYAADADEGLLSRYRASLVKENSLAAIARTIKLNASLRLGPGELKSGGDQRDSILADAFEALIGAIYIDGGFDAAKKVLEQLFAHQISEIDDIDELKDSKSKLQEYLQSKRLTLPEYSLVSVSGQVHARRFVVECKTSLLPIACQGEGSSRRRAEQAAAEAVLAALEIKID